jgi:hypothetical protein
MPDPTAYQQALQELSKSLQDFALDRLWQWIVGLVVASVIALRAHIRGVKGPWLYLPLGAVIGIGSVVAITAAITWSRAVTYSVVGAIVIAYGVRGLASVYRREQARLAKHPKGFYDYRKEIAKTSQLVVNAAGRLTKETERIGRDTTRITKQHEAMVGALEWFTQYGIDQKVKEQVGVMRSLRNAVATSCRQTKGFRDSTVKVPGLSQTFNASRAELVEGIDLAVTTMESTVNTIDAALDRLGG